MITYTTVMDTWGWIAAYAVGLTVLQLLMYRYLARHGDALSGSAALSGGDGDEESRHRSASMSPERTYWMDEDHLGSIDRPRDDPADARVCPYCDVENEPERAFARCWNCAGRLE